jgi:hypothetical protein
VEEAATRGVLVMFCPTHTARLSIMTLHEEVESGKKSKSREEKRGERG